MARSEFYDVTPDGQRFLINTSQKTAPVAITVLTNWAETLKR